MKTLLITYYWFPYNNSGTFRWTNFSKFMEFDVLTCRHPLRSFKDFSIETPNQYDKVWKFGFPYEPAVIWGFFAPFVALFKRYDVYIFTSPPESMLFGAWILQKLGRNVVIDMRDSIQREKQYFKSLVKFYRFFYNRMKNVVVCYKFLDKSKTVIYSGYEHLGPITPFKGYYPGRVKYNWFKYYLTMGYMPEQHKEKGYGSGSSQTYRWNHLPLPEGLHPEVYNHKLRSIKESANEYKKYINEHLNRT